MNKFVKITLILIFLVSISSFACYIWYKDATDIIENVETKVSVKIPYGQSSNETLKQLEELEVIKSAIATRIFIMLNHIELNFRFGEYELIKNNDLAIIFKTINKGTFAEGVKLTIKEGLRDDQIVTEIIKVFPNLKAEKFNDLIQRPNFLIVKNTFPALNELFKNGLSGMLFPDTYNLEENSDEEMILTKFVENFYVKTSGNNYDDIFYKNLILASIVEREASAQDDADLIASVFKNRLRTGMALQSDATVNFITKKNDPGVLIADTLIDSPYNTYKYRGLPPKPISNPGTRAINAALSHRTSDWYFFFHFNENTYYSKTFSEHTSKLKGLGLL